MVQENAIFTQRDAQNPYQPLVEIIGILLRKIEITPKSKLWTGNPVELHISETSFPQNASGAKELAQILNTLKQSGSIGDIEYNRYGTMLVRHILRGVEPESEVLFMVFYPNKEKLIKEREKWIKNGDGHFTEHLDKTKKVKDSKSKLTFYPESGDIEYRNEVGEIKHGNKDYALLSVLQKNKNMPFNLTDIQSNCNPLVGKEAHKFKGEKDIDDTIRQIRFKLKVKKGAFFPITKKGEKDNKKWLWIEK